MLFLTGEPRQSCLIIFGKVSRELSGVREVEGGLELDMPSAATSSESLLSMSYLVRGCISRTCD